MSILGMSQVLKISPASTTTNQVRHALRSMASVVVDVVSPGVFDELPQWDDEEMCGDNSLSEVIWVKDVSKKLFNEEYVPQVTWELPRWDDDTTWAVQAEYLAVTVSLEEFNEMPTSDLELSVEPPLVLRAGVAQEVLDGIPISMVLWDEMSNDHVVHEDLLEQLAQSGEHLDIMLTHDCFLGSMQDLAYDLCVDSVISEKVSLEAPIVLEKMHQGREHLSGNERKPTASGVSILVGLTSDSVRLRANNSCDTMAVAVEGKLIAINMDVVLWPIPLVRISGIRVLLLP
jgi:hypothetical protein